MSRAEAVVLIDLEENIDSLTYEDLKSRCKTYGIKCNIKKKEMQWALKRLAKGKTVPTSYYTKSWISNPVNKKKIIKSSIGIGSIIILIIIGYILFSYFGGNTLMPTNSTNITNSTF